MRGHPDVPAFCAEPISEYMVGFIKGYTDASRGRPYDDGMALPNTFIVCVPGRGVSTEDGYCDGWLEWQYSWACRN